MTAERHALTPVSASAECNGVLQHFDWQQLQQQQLQ